MPTTIAVRGNAEERIDPELGVVSLSVGASGAEREHTLARTTEAHERLVADVLKLEASGVLDTWSADQLRVWSHRPWNAEGKQLPVVHAASADLEVVFSDLERLGEWVSEISLRSSVTIGGIEWKLTDATRRTIEEEAQRAAVVDAVAKASVYAAALGLGSPTPVELADTGLLTTQQLPPGVGVERMFAMRGAADASGGASPAQFTPAKLVIAASVDARFAAEPA